MRFDEQIEKSFTLSGEALPVVTMHAADNGCGMIVFRVDGRRQTVTINSIEEAENVASVAAHMAEWMKAQERAKRAGGS